MPDVDRVLQVEVLGHRRSVGGVVVHVVTIADLGRAPVAAAIMGDDAEASGDEEQHLCVPIVRAERPAVMEHDGLGALRAPVLVVNLGTVLGGDERHGIRSC